METGNPSPRPCTATALDLAVEHYMGRDGYASLGAFYKRMDSFITSATTLMPYSQTGLPTAFLYPGVDADTLYNVVRPLNGSGASILGVEAAVQRDLRCLPASFDGLGVQANATFASGHSEVIYDDTAVSLPLIDLSRWSGNATLLLHRKRLGCARRPSLSRHVSRRSGQQRQYRYADPGEHDDRLRGPCHAAPRPAAFGRGAQHHRYADRAIYRPHRQTSARAHAQRPDGRAGDALCLLISSRSCPRRGPCTLCRGGAEVSAAGGEPRNADEQGRQFPAGRHGTAAQLCPQARARSGRLGGRGAGIRVMEQERRQAIEHPLAYAYRVADSVIIAGARKAQRIGDVDMLDLMCSLPLADEVLDYRQRYERFETALARLTPARRAVFRMRLMDGRSRQEIAGELGLSVEEVKKHLVRAMADLALALEDDLDGESEGHDRHG